MRALAAMRGGWGGERGGGSHPPPSFPSLLLSLGVHQSEGAHELIIIDRAITIHI